MHEYYAVKRGHHPGVYGNWEEAHNQIHGYSHNCWRGFDDWHSAQAWLTEESETSSAGAYPPQADDSETYELRFDGCSRGNPGEAGCGAVIREFQSLALVGTIKYYLGTTTNNVAEYEALRRGVLMAVALGIRSLRIFGDSNLVVKQVNGRWKTNARMRPYCEKVRTLLNKIPKWSLQWVNRTSNQEADALANGAIDYSSGCDGLIDPDGNAWTYNELCEANQIGLRYPESEEDDAFAW